MNADETRNLRLNYVVNILDGAFFGMGIGFASWTTVIPLFVSQMTDSAMLIGLISAVHVMGWQVPQLLMANRVARLPRFKPMVMWMTVHERFPFLGLALIALFFKQLGPSWALGLTFLMIAWQGFGAGFTANAWQNMIGRVIPNDYLATFFGLQSSAANLLSSGTALWAGFLLNQHPFPYNFIECFVACFGCMIFSYIAMIFTRESPRENVVSKADQAPLWSSIGRILRSDRNFVWFLISRAMVAFGTMAFGFYTVYAVKHLGADEVSVGILTSVLMFTQVLSNPVLGWLADRWSHKGVLELGAVAVAASALIAWYAPTVEWMYPAMVLAAMANTAFWTVVMAVTLQFGHESDRPTYVGMANTFVAPATVVAPLLGGWLADLAGYPATFLLAAVAGAMATACFHLFLKDPTPTPAS